MHCKTVQYSITLIRLCWKCCRLDHDFENLLLVSFQTRTRDTHIGHEDLYHIGTGSGSLSNPPHPGQPPTIQDATNPQQPLQRLPIRLDKWNHRGRVSLHQHYVPLLPHHEFPGPIPYTNFGNSLGRLLNDWNIFPPSHVERGWGFEGGAKFEKESSPQIHVPKGMEEPEAAFNCLCKFLPFSKIHDF